MLNECGCRNNGDIHSVASATNKRDALARVEEIRRVHNRLWPPPVSSARNQPTVTATAASQSLAPQNPCTTSTLQQDQLFRFFDDHTSMASERHMTSGAMPHDGSSTFPRYDCKWGYVLDGNGQVVVDWDATDRGAWLKHMPW
jgi:hypothetical protein